MRKAWFPPAALSLALVGLFARTAYAHCPLCTLGAGAAALAASWLGVGKGAIGVFVGGFAVALGFWMPRVVRKQYVPRQRQVLFGLVVISTVLPLVPSFTHYTPLYVHLAGGYGTLLNRTYLIDLFLVGAVVGGAMVWLAPTMSRMLSRLRGKRLFPYQGVMITLGLLMLSAIALQFLT